MVFAYMVIHNDESYPNVPKILMRKVSEVEEEGTGGGTGMVELVVSDKAQQRVCSFASHPATGRKVSSVELAAAISSKNWSLAARRS